MRITDLDEARRNPGTNNAAKNGAGIDDLLKWSEGGDYFVTFTSWPKVGINPQSSYATPIGVYCYPLGDGEMQRQIKDDEVPFAGKQPWINVLHLSAPDERTVYLNDPAARFQTLNDHIADWLVERMPLYRDLSGGGEPPPMTNKEMKKDIIFKRIYTYAAKNALRSTPGGIFWAFSRLAALLVRYMVNDPEGSANKYKQGELDRICYTVNNIVDEIDNVPALWTRLMLDIGVDAVVDYGDGIIHGNEPTQAVFFTTKAFRVVDRIFNPRQEMKKGIDINRDQDFADLLRFTGQKTEPSRLIDLVSAIINKSGYDQQWLTLHPYTRKLMSSKVEFFPWNGMNVTRLVKIAGTFVAKIANDQQKAAYLDQGCRAVASNFQQRDKHAMLAWIDFMKAFASKEDIAKGCGIIFAHYSADGPRHDAETLAALEKFKTAFGLD